MIQDAVVSGSSVVLYSFLMDNQLAYGKWHRSSERRIARFPYGSFLLNKKWTLAEDLSKQIYRLQAVRQ